MTNNPSSLPVAFKGFRYDSNIQSMLVTDAGDREWGKSFKYHEYPEFVSNIRFLKNKTVLNIQQMSLHHIQYLLLEHGNQYNTVEDGDGLLLIGLLKTE